MHRVQQQTKFLSTPSARRATLTADVVIFYRNRFLSTPSARRATNIPAAYWRGIGNFYPRPPRGGRRQLLYYDQSGCPISIHALREEGDTALCELDAALNKISIHALREEGDHRRNIQIQKPKDFYPRPPRGGRQYSMDGAKRYRDISIHALREEGDETRRK